MILLSRSRDGELIARFAERLSVVPVRGSSSRGGTEALREMLAYLKQPGGRKAATGLDGPRGSRHKAKRGMLLLTQKAGLSLVPIVMSTSPAITLMRAWDHTLLPRPISRTVVVFGELCKAAASTAKAELEALRETFESALKAMRGEADRLVGSRGPGLRLRSGVTAWAAGLGSAILASTQVRPFTTTRNARRP